MEEQQKFIDKRGDEITLRLAEPADAGGIVKTLKSFAPERSYVLMQQAGKSIQEEREFIKNESSDFSADEFTFADKFVAEDKPDKADKPVKVDKPPKREPLVRVVNPGINPHKYDDVPKYPSIGEFAYMDQSITADSSCKTDEAHEPADKYTVKRLFDALKESKMLNLDEKCEKVEDLNKLLKRTDLYDKIIAANNLQTSTGSTRIEKVKAIYNNTKQESDLKKLNRVLLEEFYPKVTPNRLLHRTREKKTMLLLVATAGDDIVGILEAIQTDVGKGHETVEALNIGLHIKKDFRGLGIGSRLLQYSEEWAKENRFKKMQVGVFTANKRSINLFLKAGFIIESAKPEKIRIANEFVEKVTVGKWLD